MKSALSFALSINLYFAANFPGKQGIENKKTLIIVYYENNIILLRHIHIYIYMRSRRKIDNETRELLSSITSRGKLNA